MLPRACCLRLAFVFAVGLSDWPAAAQQIAIQQPIVGVSGVRTSVVVPDRGQAFLGGVRSAESSRQQYGFGLRGSSLGRSVSSRNSSVTVRIIGLREMDEAILQTASSNPRPDRRSTVMRPVQTSTIVRPTRSSAEEIARLEALADRADERGEPGVAKLHRATAARMRTAQTQPVARNDSR